VKVKKILPLPFKNNEVSSLHLNQKDTEDKEKDTVFEVFFKSLKETCVLDVASTSHLLLHTVVLLYFGGFSRNPKIEI
jgi:hypothetical protein